MKGRRPSNTVFFVVDAAQRLVTLDVPRVGTVVTLGDMLKAWKVQANPAKTKSSFISEEVGDDLDLVYRHRFPEKELIVDSRDKSVSSDPAVLMAEWQD